MIDLDGIRSRCAAATADEDMTLTPYPHGGGRLFVIGGPQSERQLVADFYDEENREFYFHARTDIPALLAEVERLNADLAAARAALAVEREACDAWRGHWDREGYSARLAHNARVMDSVIAHDARRAAESKALPCPDCGGTGRRVRYHGGSIADPNVIGLAMEASPCWCQAAESKAAKEQT